MPKASRGKTTKTTAEYRDAIVDAYFIQGKGITEIARMRNMSKSTISNIVKRYREKGRVEYKPQGGTKNVKIKDYHSDFLRDLIDNEEDGSILTLD
jgi:transposase